MRLIANRLPHVETVTLLTLLTLVVFLFTNGLPVNYFPDSYNIMRIMQLNSCSLIYYVNAKSLSIVYMPQKWHEDTCTILKFFTSQYKPSQYKLMHCDNRYGDVGILYQPNITLVTHRDLERADL